MPSVVTPFEYAIYWVFLAGFALTFGAVALYHLIRRK